MFSLIQIAISTVVGIVLSYVVVVVYARWTKAHISVVDTVLISLTVGVSILIWREAGNTVALNDDPIPVVSPNDILCPILTYVCLGILAAFRQTLAGPHWPRIRAWLTVLSLLVNIVTI